MYNLRYSVKPSQATRLPRACMMGRVVKLFNCLKRCTCSGTVEIKNNLMSTPAQQNHWMMIVSLRSYTVYKTLLIKLHITACHIKRCTNIQNNVYEDSMCYYNKVWYWEQHKFPFGSNTTLNSCAEIKVPRTRG